MKRILVTGGAGFIGSHLCERLLNEGNYVICLDNFFTGSKDNVKHLIGNKNFELVEHDVTNAYFAEVEQIYNLACPASPLHYQYDAIKTLKTSVLGIINMLELAKSSNARILQASTSEVYGDPKVHPQTEDYWGNVNPIGVRSCYDEGKRCAETLMMDYHRQYSVDIRIVRIFNTYGPNMDINDGRVVSNFIIQALRGEDIMVYGDGLQTRSFCYIDDLIDGLIKMMNNLQGFIGPVNLGNSSERTILDFAKIIIEMIKSKSKIIYKDLPSDDPMQRQPDLTLAKRELNWQPKIDIKIGLEKTIKYFENKYDTNMILKKAKKSDIKMVENILIENNLPHQDIESSNVELFLAYDDVNFIGIVGLEKFSDIALLRSMVIKEKFRGQGYGRKICNKILEIAKQEGIKEKYLLTCTAGDFFEHLGFKKVPRENVPDEIKNTEQFLNLCPASANCFVLK